MVYSYLSRHICKCRSVVFYPLYVYLVYIYLSKLLPDVGLVSYYNLQYTQQTGFQLLNKKKIFINCWFLEERNSNLQRLINISLQLSGENLWYFKLWWSSIIQCLKYQRSSTYGCKDIRVTKLGNERVVSLFLHICGRFRDKF